MLILIQVLTKKLNNLPLLNWKNFFLVRKVENFEKEFVNFSMCENFMNFYSPDEKNYDQVCHEKIKHIIRGYLSKKVSQS